MSAHVYPGIRSLFVNINKPVDPTTGLLRSDFIGVKIWYSTVSGQNFDVLSNPLPSGVVLAYDGMDLSYTIPNLTAGTTYYVKYALISAIEPDNFIVSQEYGATVEGEGINVTGYLTRESGFVQVAGTNNTGDFSSTTGTFRVYDFTGEVTNARDPITNEKIVTYSVKPNTTTGGLTATIDPNTGVYSASGMTSTFGSITFLATYKGSITVEKVFSVNKILPSPSLVLNSVGSNFIFPDTSAVTSTSPDITISATVLNVTDTSNLSFVATAYNSANTSLGTVALSGTGLNRTISATQFNSVGANNTKYVKVVATLVVSASLTLSDTVIINRLDNGSNAITVEISNPTHTFTANNDGSITPVTGYVNSGTTIKVREGATLLPIDNSAPYVNGSWRIVSATGTNITPDATVTIGADYVTYDTHTNMLDTADTANIVYTIQGISSSGNAFTSTVTQTFSKAKAGSTAKSVAISASALFFTRPKTTTVLTPSQIVFTAFKQNITTAISWTAKFEDNTNATYTTGTDASGNATLTITNTNFGTHTNVKVTATADTYSDAATVTLIEASKDGIFVSLSNDVHELDADALGTVYSYVGSGSDILVYEGDHAITLYDNTSPYTVPSFTTGTAAIVTDTGTISTPTYSATGSINSYTSMTANVATVTIPVTVTKQDGTTTTVLVAQSITKKKRTASIALSSTAATFKYKLDNTLDSPTSATISILTSNILTGNTWYYTVTKGAGAESARVAVTTTSTTFAYTPLASYLNMPETLTVKIYDASTGGNLLTSNTIAMNATRIGDSGLNASNFFIDSSGANFLKDASGVVTPSSYTLTTVTQNISSPTYQWQQSTNGGVTWTNITGATSSSYAISSSAFASTAAITYKCIVTGTINGVSGQTLSDYITINRLDAGSSNVSVVLSNPYTVFTGPVTGYTGMVFTAGACGISAFIGTERLTYAASGAKTFSCVYAATPTGVTLAAGTTANNVFTVPGPSSMTADNGFVDVAVTIRDAASVATTTNYRINYGISRTGSNGLNAASFAVANSGANFTKSTAGVITPTSIALTTISQNIVSPTYQWQRSDDGGITWGSITGATSSSYSVPSTDFTSNITRMYKCIVTGTINGVAGQQLSDSIVVNRIDAATNGTTGPLADITGIPTFYKNIGGAISPSSAALTAVLQNVTAPTYTWSISSGGTLSTTTGSTTTVTPNGTTSTITVTLTITGTNLQSNIVLSKTLAVVDQGVPGVAGANGLMSAYPTIYQWTSGSNYMPPRPSSDSTFTWSTGTFTPPAGWSNVVPTNTSPGNVLWSITIPLNVDASTITSNLPWTSWNYEIRAVTANGLNGAPGTPGANGAPGAAGAAGSATYLINRGTDTTSTQPTAVEVQNAIGRYAILGDIATISYNNGNNSVAYRATSSGSAATWALQTSYITGSLIVQNSISGDKIIANSLTVDKITSGGTSVSVTNVNGQTVTGTFKLGSGDRTPLGNTAAIGSFSCSTNTGWALAGFNTNTAAGGEWGNGVLAATSSPAGAGLGSYSVSTFTNTYTNLKSGAVLAETGAGGYGIYNKASSFAQTTRINNLYIDTRKSLWQGAMPNYGLRAEVYGELPNIGTSPASIAAPSIVNNSNGTTSTIALADLSVVVAELAYCSDDQSSAYSALFVRRHATGTYKGQEASRLVLAPSWSPTRAVEVSGGGAYIGTIGHFPGGITSFTGVHEAQSDVELMPGDIVIDSRILFYEDIANVFSEVIPSIEPNDPKVFGIVAHNYENLPVEYIPDNTDGAVYAQGYVPSSIEVAKEVEPWKLKYTVLINGVGEGQINVCGENGNINAGDLIVTSSIPGKGMKQSDDIIRSYTVAKARESVTFSSPTEVKMIACTYHCG